MIFIGIDVGKKGAIAFVRVEPPEQARVEVYAQPLTGTKPDEQQMVNLLTKRHLPICHAYIERAHAMPKQGSTSAVSFGTLYGMWLGMCAMADISCRVVSAVTWQKVMLAGESRSDGTKAASIRVAKRMFPGVSLLPTDRCRTDSDGMADALLIAEYGRRWYYGELFKHDERKP